MKYFLVTIILFIHGGLFAQDIDPSLAIGTVEFEDNTRINRNISSKLKSRLNKDFTINPSALFKLNAKVELGKMHTLNGMDSYKTADADITYTIKGDGFETEKINLSVKCKGTNENDLKSKLGTTLIRNRKHCEQLNTFVSDYIKKHLESCAKVSTLIDAKLAKNDLQGANLLLAYYDMIENCESVKEQVELKIIEKHKAYVCAKIIQDSKILANSADERKLNQAIDILLLIPPDATCSEEAIEVAELVNKNALALSQYKASKIKERIVVRNNRTVIQWQQWYRKNLVKHSYYQ